MNADEMRVVAYFAARTFSALTLAQRAFVAAIILALPSLLMRFRFGASAPEAVADCPFAAGPSFPLCDPSSARDVEVNFSAPMFRHSRFWGPILGGHTVEHMTELCDFR